MSVSRERGVQARLLAGVAAALVCSGALGLSCGTDAPSRPAAGASDAGDAGCSVWLGGLVPYGDAGLLLDDAGFACVALFLRDDAGTRTSFSLTPVGALPAGVEAFNAVLVFDGGPPQPPDAGPGDGTGDGGQDAAPLTLASPQILQASASTLVADTGATVAFSLQKPNPPGTKAGAVSLWLTEVPDAGSNAGGGTVLGAHGLMDATLPYMYGPRNDGGPVDAGFAVRVHATF
jgi:hypothetical protein